MRCPLTDKERLRARDLAKNLARLFDLESWYGLARLLGEPFPFEEIEKVDLLQMIREEHLLAKREHEEERQSILSVAQK